MLSSRDSSHQSINYYQTDRYDSSIHTPYTHRHTETHTHSSIRTSLLRVQERWASTFNINIMQMKKALQNQEKITKQNQMTNDLATHATKSSTSHHLKTYPKSLQLLLSPRSSTCSSNERHSLSPKTELAAVRKLFPSISTAGIVFNIIVVNRDVGIMRCR